MDKKPTPVPSGEPSHDPFFFPSKNITKRAKVTSEFVVRPDWIIITLV